MDAIPMSYMRCQCTTWRQATTGVVSVHYIQSMGTRRPTGYLPKQTMVRVSIVPTPFDFDSPNIITNISGVTNISGQLVDRWVQGDAVTYSCWLREFEVTTETPCIRNVVPSRLIPVHHKGENRLPKGFLAQPTFNNQEFFSPAFTDSWRPLSSVYSSHKKILA